MPVNVRNIGAARNAGGRVAKGETILFVDADTHPTVEAVRGVLTARRQGAIGGGTYCRLDEPVPRWAHAYARWIWWWMRRLRWAPGCFFFVARDVFEKVGGFDESLYASEEITFSRAVKRRGPFAILPYPVVTSGRKLRTYSSRELLATIVRLSLRPWLLKRRSALELWYGRRRADRP